MRGVLAFVLVLAGAGQLGAEDAAPSAGEDPKLDASRLLDAVLGTVLGPVDGPTLQKEVEDAGGIPFKRDVGMAFLKRAQLAGYLREVLDDEYPPERARADARLLTAFDLLPPGTDLRGLRAKVLEENIAGFYDERPGKRCLYAISEDQAFTPTNQIILAHELRHALQDQYTDLHDIVGSSQGDFDDRSLALLSLYEGDATLVMERFVRARVGALGPALEGSEGGLGAVMGEQALLEVPGAPPVVRDHMVQPYVAGLGLAQAIWTRGGPDAMREAWQHPPDSTEQVLHPRLFFERQKPLGVKVRSALPPDARLLSEGVFGELLLRTLLGPGHDEAAAGWGGDAWSVWDVRGRTALVWRSEWDTAKDSAEFHAALRQRFVARFGAPRSKDGWDCFEGTEGWSLAMRRTREGEGAVELVSTDDAATFTALLGGEPRAADAAVTAGEAGGEALDIGGGTIRVPPAASEVDRPSTDGGQGGLMATSTPPGNQTNLGMAPNVAGLLCYVPCCIGLIFSVVAAIVEKQSRFVRFHAFQSLLLNGVVIVLMIALQIFAAIVGAVGVGILGALVGFVLMPILGLGYLGVNVFLMIKANAGEELELPVIGPMARQWV